MAGAVQKAAHELRALGWSLVPVTRAKKPLCSWKGLARGLPIPTQIDGWFRRWPSAGIAVIAGSVSGLLILDADREKGVAEAEARGVPHTPMASTPRAGRHYYFRSPGLVRNAAKLGESRSLDVRAETGYVLAPPSVNCVGAYRWIASPWETPLADAPAWLLDLCNQRRGILTDLSARSALSVQPVETILARLRPDLQTLVRLGHHVGDGLPSRSEADFAVISGLLSEGATFEQIREVFETCEIGEKYRAGGVSPDQPAAGKHAAERYLKRTIEEALGRGTVLARRTARIRHADLRVVGCNGIRIYLAMMLDGDPFFVRAGVTAPTAGREKFRRSYESLFSAAGLSTPPPEEGALNDGCRALQGRQLVVELNETGSDYPVNRYLPLDAG